MGHAPSLSEIAITSADCNGDFGMINSSSTDYSPSLALLQVRWGEHRRHLLSYYVTGIPGSTRHYWQSGPFHAVLGTGLPALSVGGTFPYADGLPATGRLWYKFRMGTVVSRVCFVDSKSIVLTRLGRLARFPALLQWSCQLADLELDWAPFLRQPVKTQFSLNGEESHELVSKIISPRSSRKPP